MAIVPRSSAVKPRYTQRSFLLLAVTNGLRNETNSYADEVSILASGAEWLTFLNELNTLLQHSSWIFFIGERGFWELQNRATVTELPPTRMICMICHRNGSRIRDATETVLKLDYRCRWSMSSYSSSEESDGKM